MCDGLFLHDSFTCDMFTHTHMHTHTQTHRSQINVNACKYADYEAQHIDNTGATHANRFEWLCCVQWQAKRLCFWSPIMCQLFIMYVRFRHFNRQSCGRFCNGIAIDTIYLCFIIPLMLASNYRMHFEGIVMNLWYHTMISCDRFDSLF